MTDVSARPMGAALLPDRHAVRSRFADAQRSFGEGWLGVARGSDGSSRLSDLRQSGCARLRLPRLRSVRPSNRLLDAVAINTGGGLTGGDRLHWRVDVGAGATASVTSQACERLYRAHEGHAQVHIDLVVEAGGTLLWWPQETIAFDGAAMRRRLEARVDEGATLLVVEAMQLGRAAMGETVKQASLRDRWHVRNGASALIHAEALRIDGARDLNGPAGTGGRTAFATVLLVAPDAARHLAEARAILGPDGAASCWEACSSERLLARIAAPSSYALRRRLVPLAALLAGRDVPRGWSL